MTTAATVETTLVPMRDGVRLASDVYRPASHQVPTILLRTPYGRRVLWELTTEVDPWQGVREGFAVVFQDVRGRGESEGPFVHKRTDAADGADTISWIRSQPWSDGRVVMSGMSYNGIVQFLAASAKPPGLMAIAPTMSGEEHEIWFWNGAMRLHGLTNWIGILIREARDVADPSDRPRLDDYLDASPLEKFHQLVTPGTMANKVASPVMEWIDPLRADEYYQSVRIRDDLVLPGLHTTGWYDISRPATLVGHERMSMAAPDDQMLLIGPWAHGTPAVAYDCDPLPMNLAEGLEYQFNFFRHALGEGRYDRPPAARTYVLGADRWDDHDTWPPRRGTMRRWLLSAVEPEDGFGGCLVAEPAPEAETVFYDYDPDDPVPTIGAAGTAPGRIGPHDQSPIEARADVLTFTTATLGSDLEICGRLKVVLCVTSSAPATDFVARLTAVKKGGRSLNLIEAYWSGRLDALAKSEVNSRMRVCEIDFSPLHAMIPAGERMRLQVTSSDYPEIYPNPNTGHDPRTGKPPLVRTARQTLLVGCRHGGELIAEVRA
jgi:putative CocE/NonD family hydrolase